MTHLYSALTCIYALNNSNNFIYIINNENALNFSCILLLAVWKNNIP